MQLKSIRVWFADFWHPERREDIEQNPIFQLLSMHFSVVLDPRPDVLFYSVFGNRHLSFICRRIQYIGENQLPNEQAADYSFSFVTTETDRHFRLPLYRLYGEFGLLKTGRRDIPDDWHSRDFCSFVVSNPDDSSQRVRFFEALSGYRPVSSGGKVLNNIGGPVADKMLFLKRHRFTIAFENSVRPGYTTEKIVQAFAARCIPIYYGDPCVASEFNPAAFVNCHSFDSLQDAVNEIRRIDQSAELASRMLAEPIFANDAVPECCTTDAIVRKLELALTAPARVSLSKKIWQRLQKNS